MSNRSSKNHKKVGKKRKERNYQRNNLRKLPRAKGRSESSDLKTVRVGLSAHCLSAADPPFFALFMMLGLDVGSVSPLTADIRLSSVRVLEGVQQEGASLSAVLLPACSCRAQRPAAYRMPQGVHPSECQQHPCRQFPVSVAGTQGRLPSKVQ